MLQAGTQAAAVIMRTAGARIAQGADVFVGSGNNGGDGYIVAAQLVRLGVNVRAIALKPPSTPDAQRAAALMQRWIPDIVAFESLSEARNASTAHNAHALTARGVIIDALLGTGARGELRDNMRDACEYVHAAKQRGALVVSLDMPTGVNATTGECVRGHIMADATIMFGTLKLGALRARHACGDIAVVDIGLGAHATQSDGAAQLATREALRAELPSIEWNAHKGTRGRTLIVGGNVGMAGAVHLACAGALASGAGLVRASVARGSVSAVQGSSVAVVCTAWPDAALRAGNVSELAFDHALDEALQGGAGDFADAGDASDAGHAKNADGAPLETLDHEHMGDPGSLQHDIRNWAHVVAIGPGLGRGAESAKLLHYVLECVAPSDVALVLDADALTVMAQYGMLRTLRQVATARPVVITPHLGEFRSLGAALDIAPDDGSPNDRLRAAREMAGALHCAVLCKGTPNICAPQAGDAWVIPRGSSALATGGTGDVLTGVVAALLATARANANGDGDNTPNIASLTALAAWVHGVAGETLTARGNTVIDVVRALPYAWNALSGSSPLPPGVLAELPAVHESALR